MVLWRIVCLANQPSTRGFESSKLIVASACCRNSDCSPACPNHVFNRKAVMRAQEGMNVCIPEASPSSPPEASSTICSHSFGLWMRLGPLLLLPEMHCLIFRLLHKFHYYILSIDFIFVLFVRAKLHAFYADFSSAEKMIFCFLLKNKKQVGCLESTCRN